MNNQINEILRSKASINDVEFTEKQQFAAQLAMIEYSTYKVNEYKESERKSVNLEAINLFKSLFVGDWKLFLRKLAFIKAKKSAQIRADIENRPFYVIRATEISYVVQSTLEVRNLKRRKIYGRHATAIRLRETADFVATPKTK